MTEMKWVEAPPARPARRANIVAAELRAKPGRWALIDTNSSGLLPWWLPLSNSDDFEIETRKSDPADRTLFGPVDVYARYVSTAPAEVEEGPQ